MSWQQDLDEGLAQLLGDAGVGTWAPDDVIDGQTNPIIVGSLPPDIAQCVGIITVPMADGDPVHPVGVAIAQFRIRGTMGQNRDTAAAIDAAVNGLANVQFGAVTLTQALSQSSTADAPNDAGQLERTLQYRVDLDLPATALRAY